ncbi:MAG: transporter substrate-binding domain-containing protein [Cyanobacteria bacterium J06642_2]
MRGSTAEAYLEKTSTIDITAFEIIERAYRALVEGEVEAVVYDAPVLQNYVLHKGAGQVQVVGQPFQLQSYGVVLQENSIYQEDINRALLKLRENGSYDEIYQSWFGAPEES